MKTKTSLKSLCQGCPAGMLKYIKAVRGMAYDADPDYKKLDAMLQSIANVTRPMDEPTESCERPAKLRRSARISSQSGVHNTCM